jgi:hypothetical protein
MKKEELKVGECYRAIYSTNHYLIKIDRIDRHYAFSKYVQIAAKTYNGDGGFGLDNYNFQPATEEERHHIEACIEAKGWVNPPIRTVIDNFQIY